MLRFRLRPLIALFAVAAAFVMVLSDADARPRTGGSRGSRTYSAPPPTATAPSVRPIERSMTQPTQTGALAQRPTPAPTPPTGGLLGRPGFMGGLFAGFLGAGLLGMLFGHGLTGGLGGFASLLGLMLQIGIAALIGYLLWSWWQRRSQPAYASGPAVHDMSPAGSSYGPGGGAPAGTASGTDGVGLTPEDYNTFERMLGEIQTAYGAEDLTKLRTLMTPEAVAYSSDEMAMNASSGVINRLSDIKLLKGDLEDAWREGDIDFATVVLRYSLVDQTVDRATGRVVKVGPSEATEVWTFMRKHGGGKWLLSEIQEAS